MIVEIIEKYKNKIYFVVCILLVVLVFAAGWMVCRHYEPANDTTINRTVDNVHADADRAGYEIDTAGKELESGQKRLSDATATTDRIAERNTESASLIEDCRRLLDELAKQCTDIESANKTERERE